MQTRFEIRHHHAIFYATTIPLRSFKVERATRKGRKEKPVKQCMRFATDANDAIKWLGFNESI